jgi:uncharacterized protein (TIGR03067 family)
MNRPIPQRSEMMRKFLSMMLFVVCVASISCAKTEAEKKIEIESKERQLLQGKWRPISAVADGQKAPMEMLEGGLVTFEGDQMISQVEDEVTEICRITLNPMESPKAIDLAVLDENGTLLELKDSKNQSIPWIRKGIYTIDGDTLTVCTPAVLEVPRPTQFDALEGTGLTVMTFQRVR